MKKCRLSTRIMLGIWVLMAAVNVLARCSRTLTDAYIHHVFPVFSGFWCRVSGLFPFSVGEWLIVAGITAVIAGIVSFVCFMIFAKGKRKRIARIYGHFYGWILTWLFAVLTLHFFVLYQGTQMSDALAGVTYTNEEVLAAYAQLVDEANALAAQVQRDETGHFVLSDPDGMMAEAKHCMQLLGEDYPQYTGYYPDAKTIYHSYFFTQQGLVGIYFPFSMEANYNPAIYDVNVPDAVCHEYTHLKGNIFEDEAGYLAFCACRKSEDPDFRYSGYAVTLSWLDLDFGEDDAAWERFAEIESSIDPGLRRDMYVFVPEEFYEEHADEEVIPTAIVSNVADTVMDTSLKINGIPEGSASYYGLTALVLSEYIGRS